MDNNANDKAKDDDQEEVVVEDENDEMEAVGELRGRGGVSGTETFAL